MRLFETIVDANQRAAGGGEVSFDLQPYSDSLPVVALTCVDPRLNRLFPNVLGIPEDQFIWLRNAGNIIFDPMSSMTRTLALSCAVKGGKEIAVIGHTDCKVGKISIVELIDRFRASGVDRSKLPDNLNEFFGLFASERQNVMRAVEFVRQSPLIGSKVPVHGLMVDIQTGRLEWVVNGYQAFSTTATAQSVEAPQLGGRQTTIPLPEFKIGEMKFPDIKIGELATPAPQVAQPISLSPTGGEGRGEGAGAAQVRRVEIRRPAQETAQPKTPPTPPPLVRIDPSQMYKVMGDDRKIYGPVLGREIERWLSEGRIDLNTLAQKVGYKNWKRLADFAEEMEHFTESRDQNR